MRLDFYESGQVMAVSATDNYTLATSEVAINGTIYKKKHLREYWSISQEKGESSPADKLFISIRHTSKSNSAILSTVVDKSRWDEVFFNGGGNETGLEETYERISSGLKQ